MLKKYHVKEIYLFSFVQFPDKQEINYRKKLRKIEEIYTKPVFDVNYYVIINKIRKNNRNFRYIKMLHLFQY